MTTPKACADIHRELFPTYHELLLECCRKEAALIRAEAEITALRPRPSDFAKRIESGMRDAAISEVRANAFRIVERELRAHELSVCRYTPGDGNDRPDSWAPFWEGEAQDGWALISAVDELAVGEGKRKGEA